MTITDGIQDTLYVPDAARPAGAEAGASAKAANATEPRVIIKDVRKRFQRQDGTVVMAVDGVSLDVGPGEFVVLLGPSGCGKSTLLRCIAGLEQPDGGEIWIHGRQMFSAERKVAVPPEERDISMMFQTYALWPHMTVRKNVAYPLEARRVPKDEVRARVDRVLDKMNIGELAEEYPSHLSGGQQQRVALSRSLVTDPRVIVFDEPLSNLDAKIRKLLRVEISRMQREFGFSAVYVTHDQEEAMHIADRVVMMQKGRIVRMDDSRSIYERPGTRYVAGFLGVINEVHATVVEVAGAGADRKLVVDSALGRLHVASPAGAEPGPGDGLWLGVRAEAVKLTHEPAPSPAAGEVPQAGSVVRATFLGNHMEYLVQVQDAVLEVWTTEHERFAEGSAVWVSASRVHVFAEER